MENNLKVSYSSLPNISSIISSHNRKILNPDTADDTTDETCDCRAKAECPLSGSCLDKHLIYQCTVKSSPDDEGVNYIGLTENILKRDGTCINIPSGMRVKQIPLNFQSTYRNSNPKTSYPCYPGK